MIGPGSVIADRYRLERVLGRGGMGLVVEARHVQLDTMVALKFLHKDVVGNPSLTERFLREARATAALKSEHVCRVFDVGTFEGTPYIVMERLDGTDLAKLVRQRRRLPVVEACAYVIQACAGLAEAHAAQIVHRDLKPGNLFLTARSDGSPLIKVLDFGIAKAPQDGDTDLTGTHTVLGSPSYMSLEQLRSSKLVDARSDIWSLGVILFELVAGRRPFVGDGVADLALKIALEPTPRLPEGPTQLDDIIARCLARDPAQRFVDVGALARALKALIAALGHALAPEQRVASSAEPVPPPAGELAGATHALATPTHALATPTPALATPTPALTSPTPTRAQSAVLELSQRELLTYEPGTTMHSAGAIEVTPPGRAARTRATVLGALGVATAIGVLLGIAATRGDDARAPASEIGVIVSRPAARLVSADAASQPAAVAAVVPAAPAALDAGAPVALPEVEHAPAAAMPAVERSAAAVPPEGEHRAELVVPSNDHTASSPEVAPRRAVVVPQGEHRPAAGAGGPEIELDAAAPRRAVVAPQPKPRPSRPSTAEVSKSRI